MANFRRKKPVTRTYGKNHNKWKFRKMNEKGCYYYWMSSWPKWWDVINHTRPNRRANAVCEMRIRKGVDADNLVWPTSKKPHQYYW